MKVITSFFFLILLAFSSCGPRNRAVILEKPCPIKDYTYKSPYDFPEEEEVVKPYPIPKRKGFSKGLIVVDSGHGGNDLGAHSFTAPKYQEKFLTLSTARMLKTFLENANYDVIMTRDSDIFIPLEERAKFANDKKPIVFVSVHFNSAPNKEAEGIEVFYYNSKEKKERTLKSKTLAEKVLKNATLATQAKTRSVKHGDFVVIRETNMPAILVEGGFLTNSEEIQNIKDPSYLKKLAWGISKGVIAFIEN